MPGRQYVQVVFLDHSNAFVRQVVALRSVVTLRWNAVSSAYLTVRDDHPIIPTLVSEEGVRAAVYLVVVDGGSLTKHKLLEGRVGSVAGNDAPFGTVTIPVMDDWADFATMLGWQVPGAAVGGQGAAEYARYTGASDTNALEAIAANAARLGRAWDVAPSLGLGTVGPLELRMDELSSKLLPPLIADRLQLTIERNDETGRWSVAVRQGEVFPRPLTPRSGVLGSWSWVKQPPTATRAVVGGRGEGVERQFVLVVDEALEAELGVKLEISVDARNAAEGEALEPYGLRALAAARGKAGLTAVLRETSWFRFPDAYSLGTRLLVRIGSLEVEDVVTQVVITDDVDKGFSVVPTVGLANEDPQERLVGFISNVATAVRGLERR